jgi:hypothetical protein
MVRINLRQVTPNVVAVDNDGAAGLESKCDALLCPSPGLGALVLVPPVLSRKAELDHYTSVDMMAQGTDLRNGLEADLVDPGVVGRNNARDVLSPGQRVLQLLDHKVPEKAAILYKKVNIYRSQTGNLDIIVNMYNEILSTLLPVEKPLL